MYSSFITYRILAEDLQQALFNHQFSGGFSTDKDDLVLGFSKSGLPDRQLNLRFAAGEMFFTEPARPLNPGFRAIRQFRPLENQSLFSVAAVPFDRSLVMSFSDGSRLVFKGYGRFGNVLHYLPDNPFPDSIFRLHLKSDWDLNIGDLRGPEAENVLETLKNDKPGVFSDEQRSIIAGKMAGSYTVDRLEQAVTDLADAELYIDEQSPLPRLNYNNSGKSTGRRMPALMQFADVYLRAFHFRAEKERRLQDWRGKVKHLEKLCAETQRRMAELESRRSYRELGDIVLTHAHLIKPGINSAFVHDYYRNEQIRIKLDPNLDAAGNAEKYYRKARNEVIEKKHLAETLESSKAKLQKARMTLAGLETAQDFRELKSSGSEVQKKTGAPDTRPYREMDIDGYTVWLGKNARSNDEMLKLASRNDLWLHARGVSGSHVIIRRKGREFPQSVIEKSAKLAAQNSKARHQGMVPVIYTERRYVSKPRNAEPGEVAVIREQVLDVFLEH